MKFATSLTLLLLLGACRLSAAPNGLNLSFATYTGTPVVVTEFTMNDVSFAMLPKVVSSDVDVARPRVGVGDYSIGYPGGEGSTMQVQAAWVELLTNRAYRADISVAVDAMDRTSYGAVRLMPVFGANGLLLMTSDPIPENATDIHISDLAQTCAQRDMAGDTDFAADPLAIAGLSTALDYNYPPAAPTACHDAGN